MDAIVPHGESNSKAWFSGLFAPFRRAQERRQKQGRKGGQFRARRCHTAEQASAELCRELIQAQVRPEESWALFTPEQQQKMSRHIMTISRNLANGANSRATSQEVSRAQV